MVSGSTSPSGPSATFSGTAIHGLSASTRCREVAAVEDLAAVGAEDAAHRAVQLDDAAAAGAHVQAVDVLGDRRRVATPRASSFASA